MAAAAEAVLAVASKQVVALGVNCCPPQVCEAAVRNLRQVPGPHDVLAYPNNGDQFQAGTRCWDSSTSTGPAGFLAMAASWLAAGCSVVGGCCRTAPSLVADLKLLAASVRSPSSPGPTGPHQPLDGDAQVRGCLGVPPLGALPFVCARVNCPHAHLPGKPLSLTSASTRPSLLTASFLCATARHSSAPPCSPGTLVPQRWRT